jgi:hypothetical protein
MTSPEPIDVAKFQLYPDLVGEDEEDTRLLPRMAEQALNYIRGFKWAPPVEAIYLAFGCGGVLAVFLVRFSRPIEKNPDTEVWVVVGDAPPAYFDTEGVPRPQDVLDTYCYYMDEWADRVLAGQDLSECYPIEAAPTAEHARMLKSRVTFIREELIPYAAELDGAGDPSDS